MNNRQVNCFLAAAESLSFSAAAHRLFLSQSSVSRNISELEAEMGVPLFYRRQNAVELSPAGSLMLQTFLTLREVYAAGLARARSAAETLEGTLRIGFLDGQMLDHVSRTLFKTLEKRMPLLRLELFRAGYRTLSDRLYNGSLDVAVLPRVAVTGLPELCWEWLCSLDTVLILPRNHPLAERSNLHLADFREDLFIIPAREEHPNALTDLRTTCTAAGFLPQVMEAPDLQTQIFWIETNKGLSIANRYHLMAHNPAVRCVQVPEYPKEDFLAVWNKQNDNAMIPAFLGVLTEIRDSVRPE